MELILDDTLEVKLPTREGAYTPKSLTENLTGKDLKTVRTVVDGDYTHDNFLKYLGIAWNHHYGIKITPDIIWYSVLCEVALHIKENTEKYRNLFTTSDKKVEISIPTGDPELLDLNTIIERLNDLVPTNVGTFIPTFTTSTEQSQLAFKAAFADTVSQYYNYSMYMCGIPKVEILGTKEDWEKVFSGVLELNELIELNDYFTGVLGVVTKLTSPNKEDFTNFFKLEQCGSGSQVEVEGWVTKLFVKVPRVAYPDNFSNHVSIVKYKCLSTDRDFELNYGLFSSKIVEDYLVPDFGYFINEVVKAPQTA